MALVIAMVRLPVFTLCILLLVMDTWVFGGGGDKDRKRSGASDRSSVGGEKKVKKQRVAEDLEDRLVSEVEREVISLASASSTVGVSLDPQVQVLQLDNMQPRSESCVASNEFDWDEEYDDEEAGIARFYAFFRYWAWW